MLSKFRFERINGHEPTLVELKGQWRASCDCACGGNTLTLTSEGWAESESRALESLLAVVLSEHGRVAMDRAGWKCEKCSAIRGLSSHHKVFRSHSRNDRVDNLQALDPPCHAAAHGAKLNIRRADTEGE